MSQSKVRSLTESVSNIVIGFLIALLTQLLLYPLHDINVGLETVLSLSFWFTLSSLIRSYALRRYFNKGDGK